MSRKAELLVRTPIVRVELQLDPPVSTRFVPCWWGDHNLKFHRRGKPDQVVWEGQVEALSLLEAIPDVRVSVEKAGRFGWVVVVEAAQMQAKEILKKLGLPERVRGASPGGGS